MIQLLKKVECELLPEIIGATICLKSVNGFIQQEDYINLPNYTGYLQNLTRAEFTSSIIKPLTFGLINSNNLPITELLISY